MSRLCTSFRPGLEQLDDRRCLSGMAMATFAVNEPLEAAGPHVRVFSGGDYSAFSTYGGFSGGVRVAVADLNGDSSGSLSPYGDFMGGVFVGSSQAARIAGNDVDGNVLASDQVWSSVGAGLDVLIANTGYDRIDAVSDESLTASGTTSSHSGGANFLFADGSVRF